MNRFVWTVVSAAAAVGVGVWFSLNHAPSSGADGMASGPPMPLADRVSQVIRNPARSPAAASQATPGQVLIAKIELTRSCFDRGNCAYPQTDPHSYDFAVGKVLAAEMRELRKDFGSDPAMQSEIEATARTLIGVEDGFVQEEAIKAFSLYPPRGENLAAMTSNLRNTSDPLIVEQAMKEMERYLGTNEEAHVQDFLVDLVAHGGQFSAEKASTLILTFLNDRSVDHFRSALAGMPAASAAARNLRSALDQYERAALGG